VTDLVVRGARQHNLRDVEVRIPRDRLTVVTGPSGSGKSSLAFDTIYAEGQRRYVESLSAYARQFLDRLPKPDVDLIEGLSPAIAIRQGSASRSPRSTVGTLTEIYDHLRLLFARAGRAHCPVCRRPVEAATTDALALLMWSCGLSEPERVEAIADLSRHPYRLNVLCSYPDCTLELNVIGVADPEPTLVIRGSRKAIRDVMPQSSPAPERIRRQALEIVQRATAAHR